MSNLPIYDSQGRPVYPTTVTTEQLEEGRQAHARRVEVAIEAHKKREADHKADRERREAEAGAAELDAYREQAKAAFLSSGGTAAEFGDVWPRLRRDYLTEQAKERVTRHERLIAQTKEELKLSGRYSM